MHHKPTQLVYHRVLACYRGRTIIKAVIEAVAQRYIIKSSCTEISGRKRGSLGRSTGLKNLHRRRPLPDLRGSVRRHAAADFEPTRIGRGIWKDQLLSDRSFRTMAALMNVYLALSSELAKQNMVTACLLRKVDPKFTRDFSKFMNVHTSGDKPTSVRAVRATESSLQ